jgi:hypothetical protein
MKTATLPSLRVAPELREAAESVLAEGETLSAFMEAAVRATVDRRRMQAEFLARAEASRAQAKRSGVYVPAKAVHDKLQLMLNERRKQVLG